MTSRTADAKDIRNAAAWAEVLSEILQLVPVEMRGEVLCATTAIVAEQRDSKMIAFDDEIEFNRNSNSIMRIRGLLVQVLARDVTADSSAEDAAAILFGQQRFGHGSGCLLDYIDDLPRKGRKD